MIGRLGIGDEKIETYRGWHQFSYVGLGIIDPTTPSRDIPLIIPGRQRGVADRPLVIPARSYIYRAALTIPAIINWDNKTSTDPGFTQRCMIEDASTNSGLDRFQILGTGTARFLNVVPENQLVYPYEQVTQKLPGAEYGRRWINPQIDNPATGARSLGAPRSDGGLNGLVADDAFVVPGMPAGFYREYDYYAPLLAGRQDIQTGANPFDPGHASLGSSYRLTIPQDIQPWTTFNGRKSAIVFEISGFMPDPTSIDLESAFAGTDYLNMMSTPGF